MDWDQYWMIMIQGFIAVTIGSIGLYVVVFMVVRAYRNAIMPDPVAERVKVVNR